MKQTKAYGAAKQGKKGERGEERGRDEAGSNNEYKTILDFNMPLLQHRTRLDRSKYPAYQSQYRSITFVVNCDRPQIVPLADDSQ